MNYWGKQCCCRSALALFWRPCLRRCVREIERGSCGYTVPPQWRSSIKLVQEPFLYLQIPSFTHSDSVTSVLKIRIVSAVATQSKISIVSPMRKLTWASRPPRWLSGVSSCRPASPWCLSPLGWRHPGCREMQNFLFLYFFFLVTTKTV